jgi:hypothetical protein
MVGAVATYNKGSKEPSWVKAKWLPQPARMWTELWGCSKDITTPALPIEPTFSKVLDLVKASYYASPVSYRV